MQIENRERQRQELNGVGVSKVPQSYRAPDFRVHQKDLGPKTVCRRPVAEPPLRLGGRLGGEGNVGVKAQRWRGKHGQPNWSLITAPDECAPAVRQRLHVKNGMPPPAIQPFI